MVEKAVTSDQRPCPLRMWTNNWRHDPEAEGGEGWPEVCRINCGDEIESQFFRAADEYDRFDDDPEDCRSDMDSMGVSLQRLEGLGRAVLTLDECQVHGVEVGNSVRYFDCQNPTEQQ